MSTFPAMLSGWFALLSLWLAYFALHSLLAALTLKRWVAQRWPAFMPAYRLAFNAVAIILLLPILWLMAAQPWPSVWQWHGAGKWVANILTGLALAGLIWSLKYYDLQEFLGLKQWRRQVIIAEDQEHLFISPMHRFVRHPWYFFAMVLLWTRDMNVAQLLSTILATAYFAIGSRLEERKLLVYHGERYRRYQAQVPGLFPLPWKFLSTEETKQLSAPAKH